MPDTPYEETEIWTDFLSLVSFGGGVLFGFFFVVVLVFGVFF